MNVDAERDLEDIGAGHIKVTNLAKLPYERFKQREGVLFSTYASLISKKRGVKAGKNAIQSRLDQVIDWFGEDFDGAIVFDESHKAKK